MRSATKGAFLGLVAWILFAVPSPVRAQWRWDSPSFGSYFRGYDVPGYPFALNPGSAYSSGYSNSYYTPGYAGYYPGSAYSSAFYYGPAYAQPSFSTGGGSFYTPGSTSSYYAPSGVYTLPAYPSYGTSYYQPAYAPSYGWGTSYYAPAYAPGYGTAASGYEAGSYAVPAYSGTYCP